MSLTPAHIELIELLARQVVAESMGQTHPPVAPKTLTRQAQGPNNQKNDIAKQNPS